MTTLATPSVSLVPTSAPRTFSLLPSSLGEALELAGIIAESDFVPKQYAGKPGSVLVAIQMGADIGLSPMQALQNIAVINGRPSLWGDAALALCASAFEFFEEYFEGDEGTDGFTAVCVAKRKGWTEPTRRTFSVKDARLAGLWGKQGPWVSYSKRMLQMRARGFCLRDAAPDRLLGLVLAEEAQDIPPGEVNAAASVAEATILYPDLLESIPEGVRMALDKAFELLHLPPGLKLAKVKQFMGTTTATAEANAAALLEWCRDEYAKRKGRPRGRTKPELTKGETTPADEAQP